MMSFPRSVCALLALICVASCSPFPPNSGVRFTGAEARELMSNCLTPRLGRVTDVWTPTHEDIEATDRALWNAISEAPMFRSQVPNMRRQYIGIIVNRQRAVYVKARGQPENEAWRTEPCGGGRPIFSAAYVLGQRGITVMTLGPGWN